MADPLREYVEPSSIFADREKLPPQKFGDDNYENMVNYFDDCHLQEKKK